MLLKIGNMRGVDLDSQGIAWVAFGSGELGRFDRSKCKVTEGPSATGQQCPAIWTGIALIVVLPILANFAAGSPVTWDPTSSLMRSA